MSNNPYPVNSPSWNEWEKQVGRAGDPHEVLTFGPLAEEALEKSKDFITMVTTGHGCGLNTIGEAFHNMANHYDLFWKIEEANDQIGKLAAEIETLPKTYDTLIIDVMGADWVEGQAKQEAEYWANQQEEEEEPAVADDDWELGPVCSVEHETCESCQ